MAVLMLVAARCERFQGDGGGRVGCTTQVVAVASEKGDRKTKTGWSAETFFLKRKLKKKGYSLGMNELAVAARQRRESRPADSEIIARNDLM